MLVGVAVNGAERLANGNLVAGLFMNLDTDRRIDGIFLAFTASAEDDAGGADLFAGDGRHIPGFGAGHVHAVIGAPEPRRRLYRAVVASLRLPHPSHTLAGL